MIDPKLIGPRNTMTWAEIEALAKSDDPILRARAVIWNFLLIQQEPITLAAEWNDEKVAGMAAVDKLHQGEHNILLRDLLLLERVIRGL